MKRKSKLSIFVLTLVLLSMLASNLSMAGLDPLDVPDYPNDTDGSHNTPEGKTLTASVTYTTDKEEYLVGDIATINLTLTSVVGDANDGNSKDILFVLKDTDNTTIQFSKPDPITIDGINAYHINGGASDSFATTYDLSGATPNTTVQLPYIVYDYGKFGGEWQKTVIATGFVELKVGIELFEIRIEPTIYELVSGLPKVMKNVGAIEASVGGVVLGTSNDPSNPILASLPLNTDIQLDSQEASGYVFYEWLYNINNSLDTEDSNYRYDPRDVTVTGNNTFKPTPVFIQKPSLTLTFMQGNADPDEMRKYRVYHEDGHEALYPLTLGYEVYPGTIVELDNTFGFNHTKDLRFDDPFYFESGNKVGVDDSETVKLFWFNHATKSWVEADTKSSSSLYQVTYDLNGGTLESGTTTVYGFHGDAITEPSVSRSGFTFNGWTYETTINLSSLEGSNAALANWTEIIEEEPREEEPNDQPTPTPTPTQYQLTVIVEEGGSVPGFEGTSNHDSGTNVVLSYTVEDGYEFTGFTGDVTENTVVMNGPKTVTATFAAILEDEEVAEEGNPPLVELPLPTEPTDVADEASEEVVEEALDLLDESTPEELGEALPDAGGTSSAIFYLLGTAFTGLGASFKRKKH